jgi:hypothetical protein
VAVVIVAAVFIMAAIVAVVAVKVVIVAAGETRVDTYPPPRTVAVVRTRAPEVLVVEVTPVPIPRTPLAT